MKKQEQNIVNEPSPDYEKAETDLLRDALKRSYEERFHMMTNLMKMNLMFRKANITQKKLPSE
jgi:hypothetical protein